MSTSETYPTVFLAIMMVVLHQLKIKKSILFFLVLVSFLAYPAFLAMYLKYFDIMILSGYFFSLATVYYFSTYKFQLDRQEIAFIIGLMITISLFQILNFKVLAILDPILQTLVHRWHLYLPSPGRGAQLWFSEPAHAARAIWLISFLTWMSGSTKLSAKHFAIILLLVIFNGSATAFGLFMLTGMFYLLFANYLKIKNAVIACIILSGIVIISIIGINSELVPRLTQSINALIVLINNFSVIDLQYFGSIRFVSVLFGYLSLWYNPLGFGPGGSGHELLNIMRVNGLDVSAINFLKNFEGDPVVRPGSFASQVSMDFGIFGIVTIMILCICLIIPILRSTSPWVKAFAFTSVFQIFLFSNLTNPVPFIVLGICYRKVKEGKHATN